VDPPLQHTPILPPLAGLNPQPDLGLTAPLAIVSVGWPCHRRRVWEISAGRDIPIGGGWG